MRLNFKILFKITLVADNVVSNKVTNTYLQVKREYCYY